MCITQNDFETISNFPCLRLTFVAIFYPVQNNATVHLYNNAPVQNNNMSKKYIMNGKVVILLQAPWNEQILHVNSRSTIHVLVSYLTIQSWTRVV